MRTISIDLDDTLIKHGRNETWEIYDDVKQYLPKIYKKGFKLNIITARNEYHKEITYKTVEKIESELGIKFESIQFTNGKVKGLFAKKIGAICLIDDNLNFLRNCNENSVYPIHIMRRKFERDEYISHSNWKEIYNLLKKFL